MDKLLQVKYGELALRSPIILASSGITKAYQNVAKADQYGAGAVVLKTKFEEELMAHSPTPRFLIIRRGRGDYSSTTNLSYEQGYEYGIDSYCEEIRKCKADFDLKIIASIGCSTTDCWEKWAKMVEAAGADAIEMNLSCPHSDYVMQSLSEALGVSLPFSSLQIAGTASQKRLAKLAGNRIVQLVRDNITFSRIATPQALQNMEMGMFREVRVEE